MHELTTHIDSTEINEGLSSKFTALAYKNDLRHFIQTGYRTDSEDAEKTLLEQEITESFYELGSRRRKYSSFATLIEGADYLIYQTLINDIYRVTVAAQTASRAKEVLEKYSGFIPRADKNKAPDGSININFWYLSATGPSLIVRELEVPEWKEIKGNYSQKTSKGLDALMNPNFRPLGAGQFILWSGEPGTGKTTALRSLSHEWKDWCDIHYITDPETFFGSSGYLMSFLAQANNVNQNNQKLISHWDYDEDEEDEETEDRWMLIVLEDTGELLSHTAKAETGQGLSRFLNVVDGLIGQGLKIVVLITTNEDHGSMHPAVIRPGRCRANIEFHDLDESEVAKWCSNHGIRAAKKRMTIAELYGLLNEQIKSEEATNQFGFAGVS